MAKIKICGLSREEDMAAVNEHKPDYVGFVFAPSRRRISLEQAAALRAKLEPCIQTVGVFVNEDAAIIKRTAAICALDVVQLHGDETEADIQRLSDGTFEIWKALRIGKEHDVARMNEHSVTRYLLDAYTEGAYGGSGQRIQMEWLKKIPCAIMQEKVIVAGGLTPQNVAAIIAELQPYAVDVSSGVETDGKKDEAKITAFCKNVRKRAS